MPRSGLGVGPKGPWASAKALFLYEGSLTCTGPERGALLGPSVCVVTGNLQATGSLQGCGPLPPSWPWWQLASWDGGGLGFACVGGAALASGSLCARTRQGYSRSLHRVWPLWDIPQLRSSYPEGMESGLGWQRTR